MAKNLPPTSTNMDLKVLRASLYAAQKQDLLDKNVASKVATLKQRGENLRRAFTLEEVKKVLEQCDKAGGEWRGLVLTAVYTGQRLGDVALLTWQQVDLQQKTISFVTQKTGKRLCLSLATPLLDYLEKLPSVGRGLAMAVPQSSARRKRHSQPHFPRIRIFEHRRSMLGMFCLVLIRGEIKGRNRTL